MVPVIIFDNDTIPREQLSLPFSFYLLQNMQGHESLSYIICKQDIFNLCN